MLIAIELAKIARDCDEIPVGCVIVAPSGDIIARAHNETSSNVLHHAEMLAINRALRASRQKRLDGHILYVTLEPCPLCAAAISLAHIHTLYYGARDSKAGAVESCQCYFQQDFCHHKPQVYGGIHEEECSSLLTQFFQSKRQDSHQDSHHDSLHDFRHTSSSAARVLGVPLPKSS